MLTRPSRSFERCPLKGWKPTLALRAIACIVALLASSVAAAQTSPPGTLIVTAEGYAAIGNDRGLARDQAIRDALRRAVEQATGVQVTSRTLMIDFAIAEDHVTGRAEGFVRTYRILDESTDPTVFRVTIEAVVDTARIIDELENFGAILRTSLGNPRIRIATRDAAPDLTAEAFTEDLVRRGFIVIEADAAAEPDVIADVRTLHELVQQRPLANGTLYSVRATVTLSAAHANTNQILTTTIISVTHPSITFAQAAQEATNRAYQQALATFLQELTQALNTTVDAESNTITIVEVRGVATLADLRAIQNILANTRGVTTYQQRRYADETATFDLQGTATTDDILAAFAGQLGDARIRLHLLEQRSITIEITP
jgi:hypothetical protein